MVSYSFVHSLSSSLLFCRRDNRGLFGMDVIVGYRLERRYLVLIRALFRSRRWLVGGWDREGYMDKPNYEIAGVFR